MRLVTAAEDRLTAARMAELEADRDQLRAQNADLMATVLSLKASGAAQPLPKKAGDRVMEVIGDVAGPNSALRRQLGAFARTERFKGEKDEDIIDKLLHWDADEGGVAD